MKLIGTALALALLASSAGAQELIEGKALALDGDTLIVTQADGKEITVRLWAVDAPEMSVWPWGPRARAAIDGWLRLGNNEVQCEPKGQSYGRTVAYCTVESPSAFGGKTRRDLGDDLIGWGLAVEWRSFGKGFYADSECFAIEERRGVWIGRIFTSGDDEVTRTKCP